MPIDKYDNIVYNDSKESERNTIYGKTFYTYRTLPQVWKAMGLGDNDLSTLEKMLLADPKAGDVIEGTGGARKIRISLNDNRGKSGGGRVIYVDIYEKARIYLLFAYPKNVQENLTADQKKAIRNLIEAIEKE
ncbi:MAG: type II toxin-antitoxin system RelE/ParE family toxin [Oscillospiraceae bacterium]